MTGQPCCPDYVNHEAPDTRADREYPLPPYAMGGAIKGGGRLVGDSAGIDCVFPVPKMMEDYFHLPEAAKPPLLSGMLSENWATTVPASWREIDATSKLASQLGVKMNPAQKFLSDREALEAVTRNAIPYGVKSSPEVVCYLAETILAAGWTAPNEV